MTHVLFYGGCPWLSTGESQVSKHILPALARIGPVTALFYTDFVLAEVPDDCPYHIVPVQPEELKDPNGRLRIECAKYHITHADYDLLFLTGDINHLYELCPAIQQRKSRHAMLVAYAAIETHCFPLRYLDVLQLVDIPVVFSQFAREVIRAMDPTISVQVIYHGCEPDNFYPLSAQERKSARAECFSIDPETFLIACFNRNWPLKDIPRGLYAYSLFREKHPNSLLYIHANIWDLGGPLAAMAKEIGLTEEDVRYAPEEFQNNYLKNFQGVSRTHLNTLYNCADLCISTSMGEGWGLTTTEAMTAGTPFLGPRNSTFPEILGNHEERGLLANSGGIDLWNFPAGTSIPREMVSVTSMVDKMVQAYQERNDKAKERACAAREWTQRHTWRHIQSLWYDLLTGWLSMLGIR